jgi:hypothetical protein
MESSNGLLWKQEWNFGNVRGYEFCDQLSELYSVYLIDGYEREWDMQTHEKPIKIGNKLWGTDAK